MAANNTNFSSKVLSYDSGQLNREQLGRSEQQGEEVSDLAKSLSVTSNTGSQSLLGDRERANTFNGISDSGFGGLFSEAASITHSVVSETVSAHPSASDPANLRTAANIVTPSQRQDSAESSTSLTLETGPSQSSVAADPLEHKPQVLTNPPLSEVDKENFTLPLQPARNFDTNWSLAAQSYIKELSIPGVSSDEQNQIKLALTAQVQKHETASHAEINEFEAVCNRDFAGKGVPKNKNSAVALLSAGKISAFAELGQVIKPSVHRQLRAEGIKFDADGRVRHIPVSVSQSAIDTLGENHDDALNEAEKELLGKTVDKKGVKNARKAGVILGGGNKIVGFHRHLTEKQVVTINNKLLGDNSEPDSIDSTTQETLQPRDAKKATSSRIDRRTATEKLTDRHFKREVSRSVGFIKFLKALSKKQDRFAVVRKERAQVRQLNTNLKKQFKQQQKAVNNPPANGSQLRVPLLNNQESGNFNAVIDGVDIPSSRGDVAKQELLATYLHVAIKSVVGVKDRAQVPSVKVLTNGLSRAFTDTLNRRDVPEIEVTVPIALPQSGSGATDGESSQSLDLKIIEKPIGQLDSQKNAFASHISGPIHHVTSLDAINDLPVNALTVKAELGKFSFKALRHGAHCAFGIKGDKEHRAEVNRNRVRASVQVHAETAPERLEDSGQTFEGKKIYDLNIVSINLETPNTTDGGPRIKGQNAAFNAIEDEARSDVENLKYLGQAVPVENHQICEQEGVRLDRDGRIIHIPPYSNDKGVRLNFDRICANTLTSQEQALIGKNVKKRHVETAKREGVILDGDNKITGFYRHLERDALSKLEKKSEGPSSDASGENKLLTPRHKVDVGPVLVKTVINGHTQEIYVRPKFTKFNAPVQSVSDKSYGGKYLHNRAETRALNKSPATSLFGDLNKRELGGVVAGRISELKTRDPLKGAVIEALAKEVKLSYAAQQSGLKSRHGNIC